MMKVHLNLVMLMSVLWLAGCSGGAPEPLAEMEIPGAIAKAFANADAPKKSLADQAVQSLLDKQYGKALIHFQNLCALPDLNREQRNISSRALLAINEILQTAREAGDRASDNLLRFHDMNK